MDVYIILINYLPGSKYPVNIITSSAAKPSEWN